MEDISPTIILLWEVKRALEKGESIQSGVNRYLAKKYNTAFSFQVEQWWIFQTNRRMEFNKSDIYMTRKYLFEILEVGLSGQAILETLKIYEKELIQSCEDEIQSHIARLPLILMIPLMGLIFPALMLLLIGPLLSTFAF